ncbi:nitroimidazol reductase NimA-like FMN-containing flavoprotein (pyridoxamine 5'-phosphate oxidase superfamily) [Bacilli bacterium PM5-3]|nr:nitroimidazol reductase NimA-like FMN-containing flavoprotein (pyridoxamine 5'-phosphate oxidase superfamily) [Bacilli bacterium PM5-3]
MKHEMRRKDRKLSDEATLEILEKGEYGVLASVDENNQPYGVPISYVLHDDYIYCHCAKSGHKLDNMKINDKVSFTVVGKTQPVFEEPENDFSTYFESAIIFGKYLVVEDDDEKIEALKVLCEKYLPDFMDKFDISLKNAYKATYVFKISIDEISGKAKKKN